MALQNQNINSQKQPKNPETQKEQQKEKETDFFTSSMNKGADQATWIFLLIVAGTKDLFEILLNLIPVIGGIIATIVCLPLTAIIFIVLWSKGLLGIRNTLITLISQIADNLPLINFLPITFITMLLLFFITKSQQAAKHLAKYSSVSKIITKFK